MPERAGESPVSKCFRAVVVDGFDVLVGRGARENDELTFKVARPRDFWFHVAGFAGSHVVVTNPEGLTELPKVVLERAAELAAWNSKAREAGGKVEVHVCRVSDVSKPKGLPPGKVQLKRHKTVRVYAREE